MRIKIAMMAALALLLASPAIAGQLGVYKGGGTAGTGKVPAFEAWLGRPVDRALDFLPYANWTELSGTALYLGTSWQAFRSPGWPMTISVPMLPNDGVSTLAQGAAGAYDARFTAIGKTLVAKGFGNAVLRIGWEFNGGWYPWAAAKDPASFVAYWQRIVTAFRAVPGAAFTFDWCLTLGWNNIPADRAYPGDAYVDVIGVDVYNVWWDAKDKDPATRWATLRDQNYGLAWHKRFAAAHGKLMSFPEWGTGTRPDGHGGGDDPLFVRNMAAWIASLGELLLYHDYWDYPASDYNAQLSAGAKPLAAAAFLVAFGPMPPPPRDPSAPALDPRAAEIADLETRVAAAVTERDALRDKLDQVGALYRAREGAEAALRAALGQ
jgi:hypothetical protein